jgi:hypothetical protein
LFAVMRSAVSFLVSRAGTRRCCIRICSFL